MTMNHTIPDTGPRTSEKPFWKQLHETAMTENLEREAREAGVERNLATALVSEGFMTPEGEATENPPWWDRFTRLYLPSGGSFEGSTRISATLQRRFYERRRREAFEAAVLRPYRFLRRIATMCCVMLQKGWRATLPFWYVAGLTMAVTLGTVLASLALTFIGVKS
jgi:hypothetical protein